MKSDVIQHLLAVASRRPFTPEEQAEWEQTTRRHPAQRESWEEDLRLSQSLASLPSPPVPNNFVARVLAEVDGPSRPRPSRWAPLKNWLPCVRPRWAVPAIGFAVIALAGLGVHHQQRIAARAEVVQGMQSLVTVSEVPSLEMLRDFDLILSLPEGPVPAVNELASALP